MIALELRAFLGAAEYFDSHPDLPESHARIYVKFRPEGVDSGLYFLALLDTGALYCILNKEVARLLRYHLTDPLERVAIRTAHGLIRGDLHTHKITMIAEAGEPLDIDATVLISPEWQGPTVFGYAGLLERIRFAVDPAKNYVYFALPVPS